MLICLFFFLFQAYLSAIIVYLYANDFKQAEKCYNDCSQWVKILYCFFGQYACTEIFYLLSTLEISFLFNLLCYRINSDILPYQRLAVAAAAATFLS